MMREEQAAQAILASILGCRQVTQEKKKKKKNDGVYCLKEAINVASGNPQVEA